MRGKIFLLLFCVLSFINLLRSQDSTVLVSAFFGLDNALPFTANFLCPGAFGMDGIPVNFKFPIDASSLSPTDFEVVDSVGTIHIPSCAILAPANEDGENRTVLLIGEFGTAISNPPVEVRVVNDLLTAYTLSGESACSETINLNGISTRNVVPLEAGPSLFFAQKISGAINKCNLGSQTIQVAWNGGVTPFRTGDTESDLFQYYIGYSDSSGVLVPHLPISIADINDNDNFHQLCFSTNEEIVKISMMANTVEDPNRDPNLYSEIEVSYCDIMVGINTSAPDKKLRIYPNPFTEEITIENLLGDEFFKVYDVSGREIISGACNNTIKMPGIPSGIYFMIIVNNSGLTSMKLIKR